VEDGYGKECEEDINEEKWRCESERTLGWKAAFPV
jgi:hypothetical protein